LYVVRKKLICLCQLRNLLITSFVEFLFVRYLSCYVSTSDQFKWWRQSDRKDAQWVKYIRYVDDILIAIPENKIKDTVNVFNSLHKRLQFTSESSNNNTINFLNVNIISENNKFIFNLYHKPSFSGRYLHFLSNHPNIHKRGMIYGLVDKMWRLSHPKFHQTNLEHIIKILLKNGYPINYIFKNINNRLTFLLNNTTNVLNRTNNQNNEAQKKKVFLKIPYINNTTNKFLNVAKKHELNTIFTVDNKLTKIIKTGKDTTLKRWKVVT